MKSHRSNLLFLVLLTIGVTSQVLTISKSGLVHDYGMGFWGPNAHDGLWHVSLINQLSRFSLTHPTFPPYPLTNYHYGFDIIAALAHRISGLPTVTLYFQILPIMMSALIGILVYKYTKLLPLPPRTPIWAVFFTYFGGSFGYLAGLISGQGVDRESAFWSIQSVSYLINPPLALSLILLFSGLIFLADWETSNSKKSLLLSTLPFGSLIIVKVYAGLIVLASLLIVSFIQFITKQKNSLFPIALLSLVVSCLLFIPSNLSAPQLIKYEPFWFPKSMLLYSDRVGWEKFGMALENYTLGRNYLKLIPALFAALTIFVVGNLGTRVIGSYEMIKVLRTKQSPQLHLLFVMIVVAILPTFLFVQAGNPWNIIQFFYYAQILLGIFAASVAARHFSSIVSSALLVLLTLPTTLATLYFQYLPSRPPATVPVPELHALTYLKSQPLGIVLTYPYNSLNFSKYTEPRPIHAYESTAYVSALSSHLTFLEDEINLEISQYPWRKRKEEITNFFDSRNLTAARNFLRTNKIQYLYLLDNQTLPFAASELGLEIIYDVNSIRIYKSGATI